MKISEYAKAVEGLERGEYPDAIKGLGYTLAEAADLLGREISRLLWQPGYAEEAKGLAGRCFSVAEEAAQQPATLVTTSAETEAPPRATSPHGRTASA